MGGRDVTVKRVASLPKGEEVSIRAASRSFRITHPEPYVGERKQEYLEFFVESKSMPTVSLKIGDRLYDGDGKFSIEELDAMWEAGKVVMYRVRVKGYGYNS